MDNTVNTVIETLIFSPHVDDEILGCFAFLDEHCHVLYGGVEERAHIPRKQRLEELADSSRHLGFSWTLLENTVNLFDAASLIGPMEELITQYKPRTVLLPEPSYNQDHRAFYDAALVACRPHDTLPMVPEVLIYEQPHSVMWSHAQQPEPTLFIPIDIDAKLAAYARYASQIRGHRSPATVAALAALRGAQIMSPHAEAFQARRLIRHSGRTTRAVSNLHKRTS